MRTRPLLGCLVLSGYAGVAYELLWVRQLALVLGSTTASFSTVLGVFFGGLALGSFLASRLVDQVRRPAMAYGVIECATAALATALTFALPHLAGLVAGLSPESPWQILAMRLALSGAALLPVSTLMGMTLPFACRALIEDDRETGTGTALIYGVNTFGAFLGAYVTTYHLLGWLGVRGSSLAVVGLNVAAAVIAVLDDWRSPIRVAPEPRRKHEAEETGVPLAPFVLTFLSGLSFIALEVIWSRVASILLGGSVYGVGAVLIAVLLGIALGSGVASWIFRLKADLRLAFTVTQCVQVLALAATFGMLPALGYEIAALAENQVGVDPVHTQLLGVVLMLLVPCVAAGASLPLLVRMTTGKATEAGSALGRLYACNTVGSIFGSVVMGLWLLPQLGSDTATLLGLFAVALTIVLGAAGAARPRLAWGLVVVSVAAVFRFDGLELERLSLTRQPTGVSYAASKAYADAGLGHSVYYSEGESASVRIGSSSGGLGLTLNGLGQGGRNFLPPHVILESLLVAVMPLLHVEAPRNALVVGLGAGGTVDALADLGVPRIKVVELEPKVVTAVERIYDGVPNPLAKPGVETLIGDARHVLLVNGSGEGKERFDVIASMPAHPWVAAPIFTREFFELARRNLSPAGVFSTWFGPGQMDDVALRSLFQAFTDVFENYFVYYVKEAGAFYLVGSPSAMAFDPARAAELQAHRLLKDHVPLRTAEFFPGRVFATGDANTAKSGSARVNTDDSAYIELRAPLRRLGPLDAAALAAHFPRAFLPPAAVRGPEPGAVVARALAASLDQFPVLSPEAKPTVEVAQAEAWLKGLAADAALPAGSSAYLEGRLASLRADMPRALKAFDAVAPDSPYYVKARLEAAALGPATEIEGRLLAMPYAPEVAFALASIDLALLTKSNVPAGPGSGDEDWLVRTYVHPVVPTEADKERFERNVMTALRDSVRPLGMIRVAAEVADRFALRASAQLLRGMEANRRAAAAQEFEARGNDAYKARNYAAAAAAYERGLGFVPARPEALKKLYHSYKKLGDAAGLGRTRGVLAQLGRDEAWISALDRFLAKSDEVVDDPKARPVTSSRTAD